jgi:hypothetical protein
MSFWEWFKAGAFAAVVWNLFRNPGSCACCAVLLVVFAIVLVLTTVAVLLALWEYVLLAAVAAGIALAIREVRRPSRAS